MREPLFSEKVWCIASAVAVEFGEELSERERETR